MCLRKIVAKQYRDKVNQAVSRFDGAPMLPQEGWLRTVRTALGMTGPQLAERLGVTKARISKAEQDETAGGVTLRTMQAMAEAMDCQFVYAVIPRQDVESVIKARATEKAKAQVKAVSTQMTPESQLLTKEQLDYEVERIAAQIVEKMPADLWRDE